jgi:periplasmic protein TonB
MFDLITGKAVHAPRPRATPVMVSIAAHAALVGAVFVGTLAFVAAPVPEQPMMMAFVAAPPPPPPPPPPAPAPKTPASVKALATSGDVAPIEAPQAIEPETPVPNGDEGEDFGLEGGVPGGIPGGVVGGLMLEPEPPPPPPPLPERTGPVRIGVGGQIKEPTLVSRVDPVYPLLAIVQQLEGVVILEAIVDEEGRVENLRVLRSPGVFEKAAVEAVRQWRYSPVILNGRPEKFILTVTVSFRLDK